MCLRAFTNEAKCKTPVYIVETHVGVLSGRVKAAALAWDTGALATAATAATNPSAFTSAMILADDGAALATVASTFASAAAVM